MLIVTDKNFKKEVLDSKEPVLVDFWAPWCGPCKTMLPIFEEIAEKYKDQPIKFAKINIDENSSTPSQFGVMSIPTFIVFKNGKPLDEFVGIQTKEDLSKKINGLLK